MDPIVLTIVIRHEPIAWKIPVIWRMLVGIILDWKGETYARDDGAHFGWSCLVGWKLNVDVTVIVIVDGLCR